MTTVVYSHPDCHQHITPPGHPEQVARLEAVDAALAGAAFSELRREKAPLGTARDIERCHPPGYLEQLQAAAPSEGFVSLDADTHMSPGTVGAALRGVGGCVAAVDAVLGGQAGNAFVACRPPGHHAETAKPMGFCLFGNVSVAARHALDGHGLKRVAIIDFDVHHGNGTQDLMWNEARAMFASSHQMPLYPGSGSADEKGAHGTILNVPLKPETGGAEMRRAYDEVILPAVEEFAPELILVSAGFDAHHADPLAQLHWTSDDFAWLAGRICDVADAVCEGRIVSTLEGGYDLDALGESVAAHVRVLMERSR